MKMLKIIKNFLVAMLFTTAKADHIIEKQNDIERIRQAIVTVNGRISSIISLTAPILTRTKVLFQTMKI